MIIHIDTISKQIKIWPEEFDYNAFSLDGNKFIIWDWWPYTIELPSQYIIYRNEKIFREFKMESEYDKFMKWIKKLQCQ